MCACPAGPFPLPLPFSLSSLLLLRSCSHPSTSTVSSALHLCPGVNRAGPAFFLRAHAAFVASPRLASPHWLRGQKTLLDTNALQQTLARLAHGPRPPLAQPAAACCFSSASQQAKGAHRPTHPPTNQQAGPGPRLLPPPHDARPARTQPMPGWQQRCSRNMHVLRRTTRRPES